jgi:hypothetical protein
VITRLVEGVQGFERTDYCGECGDQATSDAEGVWEGQVPSEEEGERPPLDDKILDRLTDLLEEQKLGQAFLLALYLEREGVLSQYRARNRKDLLLFEVNASGEMLEVPVSTGASTVEIEQLISSLRT